MNIYDLIIIGAGPAGYLAAERASNGGFSVLLIEKEKIGGVCLNEGCIPSKTLLYSAKIFDGANNGSKYGISADNITLDHNAVISRKNQVVKKLVAGINAKLKAYKVEIIEGTAKIQQRSQDGFVVLVNESKYTGKRMLIATGSQPIIPNIKGVKESYEKGFVLTNKEILDLDSVPSKLVIVGGGIIGLEMASYYNSAGSKVTVIEMLDHIAGQTDTEISSILKKNYEKKGIIFNLDSKVTSIENETITYENQDKTLEISADKVLLSIGRHAVTNDLGLENIGIELNKGNINVDRYCKTNIPEVYAAGDVNGRSLLAHTAYREAEVAVNNMLGKRDLMRYDAIPSVIYTNPEVACIGETEETAKSKNIEIDTVKLSMMYSGRYVAEHEGGNGICKLIIEKSTKKLIGAHMIGNPVSEIIYGVGLMIENEMRVDDIKELVFPHPTVAEIIREGIFQYK